MIKMIIIIITISSNNDSIHGGRTGFCSLVMRIGYRKHIRKQLHKNSSIRLTDVNYHSNKRDAIGGATASAGSRPQTIFVYQ